jgi:hypothetical protein
MKRILLAVWMIVLCASALPQAASPAGVQPLAAAQSLAIPPGAKIYVAPMPDNFNVYIKAALAAKRVPVTVVGDREQADFEITGYSETHKAGAAKIIILGNWHSRESAYIQVANLRTGAVAFAYFYQTESSTHGQRSSAESCAKHLKKKIESGK